jgi:S-DNA-T family DNA segregation ATPase FtsK/SpoIIIE
MVKKLLDNEMVEKDEKSEPRKSRKNSNSSSISGETKKAIFAVGSFLIAVLAILAAFNKAGFIGDNIFTLFSRLFGIGYYLIPIVFAMLGISILRGIEQKFGYAKAIGALLFLLSGLGLIYIIPGHAGGVVGKWIAYPLTKLMDVWATALFLFAVLIASVMVTFDVHFTLDHLMFWKKILSKKSREIEKQDNGEAIEKAVANAEAKTANIPDIKNDKNKDTAKIKKSGMDISDTDVGSFISALTVPLLKPFTPPPIALLEKDRGKPETGDIKANANIIKRTLQNFNITVEMDEISIGPSVTRYALKPAEGVKLSKIVGLNNDLALALAAHPIRIEAPIPGKSLVGVEVPNTAKTTVGLATLLSAPDYQESQKPLMMSLGKDITGKAHFSNLAKAPHALIAGATGSGKSVTIHAIITSLLYRNSPENLKFIMIDPKRVELTLYNKIPHLLTPVITDPKKAILSLKWAAKEMSRRYDILQQNGVRDVESYHKTILAPAIEKMKKSKISKDEEDVKTPETMPYIVIVIDELADIMQTYPRELESAIVRLAQMSRAVGIHLILSTQRPSVNVITGLIKANIPTRIALQVASQIDSRTILDQPGAEKLLGAGDMLYLGGEMSKPVRLQSAFISESEVKRVVKHLVDEYQDEINNEINLTPSEPGSSAVFDAVVDSESMDDEGDELYESAREVVMSAGKASTSLIQRKLAIGYSRAAKLMDMLEQKGVIGPANGSKPREVFGAPSADSADALEETIKESLPQ